MRLLALFTLTMFCLSPLAIASKVYKWVDEQGRVHYSDTPQQEAEVVETKVNGTSGSSGNTDDQSDSDEAHAALCGKAATNMLRFLPEMEKLAREQMAANPSASQQEFDQAMSQLSALKQMPVSQLKASCVSEYKTDAQAKAFANCFGNANDVMEASVCMAFSG